MVKRVDYLCMDIKEILTIQKVHIMVVAMVLVLVLMAIIIIKIMVQIYLLRILHQKSR